MIKIAYSPKEKTERMVAEQKRQQAIERRRHCRERANTFVRLNPIPTRFQDTIETRHVALAVHQLIASNYQPRPGKVFERACLLASRETPNARKAWGQVCDRLKAQLVGSAFHMWVQPLGFPREGGGDLLIVEGPLAIVSHFNRRYLALAEEALSLTPFAVLSAEAYDLANVTDEEADSQ